MNTKSSDNGRAAYPDSPCNKICVIDDAGHCTGCRRTLEEISRWSQMSAEEQWDVVNELSQRAI